MSMQKVWAVIKLHLVTILTTLLENGGYQVVSAVGLSEGRMLFASHRPDLVVLDLGLPDGDGMTLLKEIRKEDATPVIVLSSRTEEEDKVRALDSGANDYVTKPFGPAELLARVRSALRNVRQSAEVDYLPDGKFCSGELEIDYAARRVRIGGEEIKLTRTEYNIIAFLSEHPGKVMTYAAIIRAIWGYNDLNGTKKLQVNMANIRKKFGATPGQNHYIANELGVGYRMCDRDEVKKI